MRKVWFNMSVAYNVIETYRDLELVYPKIYEELERDFNISKVDPYEIVNLTVFDSLEEYAYHVYYDQGLFDELIELSFGVALSETVDLSKFGESIGEYVEDSDHENIYVTSDNKVVENPDGFYY